MAGALVLEMSGGSAGSVPFSVTIPGGLTTSGGFSKTYTFGSISRTIVGGTGPFTQVWNCAPDAFGTWNTGGTSSSFTPSVSAVFPNSVSSAVYTCVVTDTGTGKVVTSNGATFQWNNYTQPVNPFA